MKKTNNNRKFDGSNQKVAGNSRRSRANRMGKGSCSGDSVDSRNITNTADAANDPSWYTNNQALVANAGNFSFNNAMGAPLTSVMPNGIPAYIPGVFEYTVQMIPGISDGPFSPINIAARALYDRVNYKNSRNFSYDAPDLMMYVYAASSLYAYWAWMTRTYGILNTYSQINRYVPDTLVKASGCNADDLRLHMSQFRYYINLFARKINVLAIPKGMPIFSRYMWLFSNVYMDADNLKAGLYISRPYGFYKYIENTAQGGACVVKNIGSGDMMTLDQIVAYGNEISEALLASQDMNNISTDVLKAFEGDVMSLPDVASDYYVTPTYSMEVLEQIHNAHAYGDYVAGATSTGPDGVVTVAPGGNLIQDPRSGYLTFEMELQEKAKFAKFKNVNYLLDSSKSNPTPEDVFVMSRYLATVKDGKLQFAGSDVIVKLRMWIMYEGGDAATTHIPTYLHFDPAKTVDSIGNYLNILSMTTKFDWAPLIYVLSLNNNNEGIATAFGDVFNYTSIDGESIRRMHETALLSLMSVPGTLGAK